MAGNTDITFSVTNNLLNKTMTVQLPLPFSLDVTFVFLSVEGGYLLTSFSSPWKSQLPVLMCHFSETTLQSFPLHGRVNTCPFKEVEGTGWLVWGGMLAALFWFLSQRDFFL